MPKTENEIIELFKKARPDYSNVIDKLTDEDCPILGKLIQSDNIKHSLKAIICIGALKSEKSLAGLEIAAKSPDPDKRVVAAFALRHLAKFQKAKDLIHDLLEDSDLGVRKFALKTVDFAKLAIFKKKVQDISSMETNERMKIFTASVKDNLDRFDNNNIIIR